MQETAFSSCFLFYCNKSEPNLRLETILFGVVQQGCHRNCKIKFQDFFRSFSRTFPGLFKFLFAVLKIQFSLLLFPASTSTFLH